MPRCRICKAELSKPLLELKNVPAAAQNMPATREELCADKGIDLVLCQCLNCGVLQHTAPPVPYYREVIRASGVSEAMKQFRLEQFGSWVKRYGLTGKKVFEAGCGRGEYLSLMNDSGVTACGTEFGAKAVEVCRNMGLEVSRTFFETGHEELPQAPYDGFFVLNFLEHIPNLPAFLDGIRKNLKPGAPGLIEVPNSDMLLKNSLLTAFSTEHIYYFTEETLTTLLHSHGFTVKNCSSVWSDHILSAEVVLRQALDFSSCQETAESLKKQIQDFLASNKKVAVWGAGHQTMTTLSITGMTPDKICFAIDSSPDKQGRFTYATHIPIVSPDILRNTDADAIIVACGGYSAEVVDCIRKNFNDRFKIALLMENKLEIL